MNSATKAVVVLMLVLGATIGGAGLLVWQWPDLAYAIERGKADARYDAASERLAKMTDQIKIVQSISEVFNVVAQKLEPSVVHIVSERTAAAPSLPPGFRLFPDDDNEDLPFPFNRQPQRQWTQATGSGVIISADGYVLTNNHVVTGASRVTVKLSGSDGQSYDAKVVGADPRTDIAVIKIDGAKGLHPAELGDSDAVRVGDWVLAIGSPFGLDRTVTTGIISAKGRANVGIADYEDFIQTDASINPGNSGGPLVDVAGKVIGINTAIASRSGGNQGVGFTIPINMIKQLLPRLEKGEQIHRGYLGVLIQPLDKKLADNFGYDSTKGAAVSEVLPDSPSKDKLRPGDIVFSVNGKEVADPNELRTAVAAVGPGQDVELGVFRDGKKVKVSIRLGELPTAAAEAGPAPRGGRSSSKDLLGIDVQTLTPELAGQLGYEGRKGVLITSVDPASEAAREGLSAGDLITQIQGQVVTTADEFAKALDKAKDKPSVRLLVSSRRGGSRFVLLPLGRK